MCLRLLLKNYLGIVQRRQVNIRRFEVLVIMEPDYRLKFIGIYTADLTDDFHLDFLMFIFQLHLIDVCNLVNLQ